MKVHSERTIQLGPRDSALVLREEEMENGEIAEAFVPSEEETRRKPEAPVTAVEVMLASIALTDPVVRKLAEAVFVMWREQNEQRKKVN